MPGLISQYQQTAFVNPQNGQNGDATIVLSNDNATRGKHNSHDADATIHVQSSDLATRPTAGVPQRVWWTTDEFRLYFDFGGVWNPLKVRAEDVSGGNLTVTGNLTVDTNTLFVDASNNRVGVGTATPTVSLDVVAGAATAARFTATGSNAQILATDGTVTQFVGYANTSVAYSGTSSNHAYALLTNNVERLRVLNSGNVGIGTASPTALLHVAGTFLATGAGTFNGGGVGVVRAAATGYSDYFEADNGTSKVGMGLFAAGVGMYRSGNSQPLSLIVTTNLGARTAALQVQHSITVDESSVWISCNGVLKQLMLGAIDSAGTGFRTVRVVN